MDELAKTEARNYLTAAGFLLIAVHIFLFEFLTNLGQIHLIAGIGLLVIGTLLIILRKRDMIAMLFMMFAFLTTCDGVRGAIPQPLVIACFAGLMLLALLITLTGKDKAKWLLFILPLLVLIQDAIYLIGGTFIPAIFWIVAIIAAYFSLACASERISLPGRKQLVADEETDFKASGSALGYLLFAVTTGTYVVHYIAGEALVPMEVLQVVNIIAAMLLIFVAILLFGVAKMRFTPSMFLLIGITDLFGMVSEGPMFIGIAIVDIIIGLFAILRKESRILPGIMLITYGCTWFFSAYAGGNMPVVSVILNAIPCLIAIYLAFVVYSQRNLPKC